MHCFVFASDAGAVFSGCKRFFEPSGHHFHQGRHSKDINHPFQVVGVDRQGHFRARALKAAHQEASVAHDPVLEASARVLHERSSLRHHVWRHRESCLHAVKGRFVRVATDVALLRLGALGLQRTG